MENWDEILLGPRHCLTLRIDFVPMAPCRMRFGPLSVRGGVLMPNYSLLFARTLQDAENSAVIDWKWEYHDQLHFAFRRPDNGEIVRFAADRGGETLRGLRWNTKVYLGWQWQARRDANIIRDLLQAGFFKEEEPLLAPPKPRRKDRAEALLSEMRKFMGPEERK